MKKLYSGYGIIVLIVISALILIAGTVISNRETKSVSATSTAPANSDDSAQSVSVSAYTEILEKKIADLCRTLSGIKDAKVLLTLDSGNEYVYAQNSDSHENGTLREITRDYLIINSGEDEKTVLIKEIYPKIRGIAVVCTNGDDVRVQKKVIDLLAAALGINSNRVCVSG